MVCAPVTPVRRYCHSCETSWMTPPDTNKCWSCGKWGRRVAPPRKTPENTPDRPVVQWNPFA